MDRTLAAIEGAQQKLMERADYLATCPEFSPYLEAMREVDSDMSPIQEATTLIMLDNLKQWYDGMDEATKSVHVGNFIHYGFELITAVMPSLLAHKFVNVQPMTAKVGEIFYLEYRYGTTKGNVSSGDTMFGYQTAGNANMWYSHEQVYHETMATGDGTTGPFSGTCGMLPAVAGTISITATHGATTLTVTDDGAGTLTGDCGAGTIDYTTGAIAGLEFTSTADAATPIYLDYRTDFEETPANIPQVDLYIGSLAVTALTRKLRARYTLDSAHSMSRTFGRSAEEELTSALASEIRAEEDGEIFYDIWNGAYATNPAWDKTPPDTEVTFRDHKYTFIDNLLAADSTLFANTRRAKGNFIICGSDVSSVIESLDGQFKPAGGQAQPGPHIIGTLRNWTIVLDPYYSPKNYVMGYRGNLWLDAGYVHAPYMALYTTPLVVLDDMVFRRGMATSYGKKMVNNKMYVKGSIVET